MKISLPIFLGSILVSASTVGAQVVLPSLADTYVSSAGNVDKHYGATTSLVVGNNGHNNKDKNNLGFVRFDISSFSGLIGAATFSLESITNTANSFELWGIPDGFGDENFTTTEVVGESADPADLTFNNSAHTTTDTAFDGNGSFDYTGLTLLGTFVAPASGGTINVSTAALTDFLNEDENGIATFIIYRTTVSGALHSFASENHATLAGPTLSVVPEPGTYALLLGGVLFAYGASRRRGRVV